MPSRKLFIVPMVACWFLLALLAPAEAGFMSWLSGKGWKNPKGNGTAGGAPDNANSPVTNGHIPNVGSASDSTLFTVPNEKIPNAGGAPDNANSPVTNGHIPNAGSVSDSAVEPLVINEDIKDATPNLNPAPIPVVTSPQATPNLNPAPIPVVTSPQATPNLNPAPIPLVTSPQGVSASNPALGPAVINEAITDATPNFKPALSPGVTSPEDIYSKILLNNFFTATPNFKPALSPVVTSPEDMYVMRTQIIDGSVYQVTINKQIQYGLCVDKVKIKLHGSKLEKTLKFKSSGSTMRRVRSEEDLLLIEDPDKDFCIFTTNKNELYYLQDGKWKKGDFSKDNTKDKELTPSEITAVKERIQKWQAFFEKYDKEIERIMNLKMAERVRFQDERARIWNEREKEIQTHIKNIYVINQLRTEEQNKQILERQNIFRILEKEGWSDVIEQLQSAEYERQSKRYAEIEELKDKEDKRFEKTLNDIEKKVSAEEIKSEEEIRRLESLEAEEEKRALQELEENIKQGW